MEKVVSALELNGSASEPLRMKLYSLYYATSEAEMTTDGAAALKFSHVKELMLPPVDVTRSYVMTFCALVNNP